KLVSNTAPAIEPQTTPPPTDKTWRETVKQKGKGSEEATEGRRDIRVDLDKLDQLINLVGELVIAESMVIHNPDLEGHQFENFERASRHLQKISRDLQDIALAIRMVPLASTFKKMLRLVHDLSNKTHKKIDLVIRGEDTEIDKTLVESLSDPLVHLIRNCADHGIESPKERIQAGKPETGTIRLEAGHEEGEVQIMVSDDGRGLNAEKIYSKALEKGLISEGQELSDKDLFKLIFEPGFSTADAVSDISGRGVGLDVLKKNLEKLQGHIDIRNRPNQGCTFILRIPLTLAIIEGMLVKVGSRHYTIPLLSIRESLKAKKEQITNTMDGRELFSLRKELIPIVRLHKLHEIEEGITEIEEGILVILESSVGTCGLLVDKVIGQQQTVIKPLSGFLGNMRGVCGCTIMGNGDISLILDISTLLDLGAEEAIA
ncbi:MAG: chemotaxis protein CheA, partial [Candidatus Cloacimonetes bacterium]|nr:chemotaxis protein CheA [Candidatus Cloacimonadota bacterium]